MQNMRKTRGVWLVGGPSRERNGKHSNLVGQRLSERLSRCVGASGARSDRTGDRARVALVGSKRARMRNSVEGVNKVVEIHYQSLC